MTTANDKELLRQIQALSDAIDKHRSLRGASTVRGRGVFNRGVAPRRSFPSFRTATSLPSLSRNMKLVATPQASSQATAVSARRGPAASVRSHAGAQAGIPRRSASQNMKLVLTPQTPQTQNFHTLSRRGMPAVRGGFSGGSAQGRSSAPARAATSRVSASKNLKLVLAPQALANPPVKRPATVGASKTLVRLGLAPSTRRTAGGARGLSAPTPLPGGRPSRKKQYCQFYNRFGKCKKGYLCPYAHDPKRVVLCRRHLQDTCSKGSECPFSHLLIPEKVPLCVHFARGNCSNSECRYLHSRVSPTAGVCRAFALENYCPQGAKCKERHVFECPDYRPDSGVKSCPRGKKCKLFHVDPKEKRSDGKRGGSHLPDNKAPPKRPRPARSPGDGSSADRAICLESDDGDGPDAVGDDDDESALFPDFAAAPAASGSDDEDPETSAEDDFEEGYREENVEDANGEDGEEGEVDEEHDEEGREEEPQDDVDGCAFYDDWDCDEECAEGGESDSLLFPGFDDVPLTDAGGSCSVGCTETGTDSAELDEAWDAECRTEELQRGVDELGEEPACNAPDFISLEDDDDDEEEEEEEEKSTQGDDGGPEDCLLSRETTGKNAPYIAEVLLSDDEGGGDGDFGASYLALE